MAFDLMKGRQDGKDWSCGIGGETAAVVARTFVGTALNVGTIWLGVHQARKTRHGAWHILTAIGGIGLGANIIWGASKL